MNSSTRFVTVAVVAGVLLLASRLPTGEATGAALGATLLCVGVDTWLHGGAFAVLGVTAAWASSPWIERTARRRMLAWAVLVVTVVGLYGLGLELLQWPLDSRRASIADAAANVIGASVGVSAAALWDRLVEARERRVE